MIYHMLYTVHNYLYGVIPSGKLGDTCARVKSRLYESRVRDHVVHLGINVSTSAHNCGYVVSGSNARTAICVLFPLI